MLTVSYSLDFLFHEHLFCTVHSCDGNVDVLYVCFLLFGYDRSTSLVVRHWWNKINVTNTIGKCLDMHTITMPSMYVYSYCTIFCSLIPSTPHEHHIHVSRHSTRNVSSAIPAQRDLTRSVVARLQTKTFTAKVGDNHLISTNLLHRISAST